MQGDPRFEEMIKQDPRYSPEAYQFVMEALAFTVKQVGERRHVTGHELLFGIRDLAIDYWGLMARHVLESWGVRKTGDFGDIVFNMIRCGLLSKTDKDAKDDFRGVYEFGEAFDGARLPDLDEHGRIRRKAGPPRPQDPAAWINLFGDSGIN